MPKLSAFSKGIIAAVVTLLATSTHPVITRVRLPEMDAYFYAILTVMFEAVQVLPIMIPETIKLKRLKTTLPPETTQERTKRIRIIVLNVIIIGGIFALAQTLFFVGFEYADAITGSIAVKSSIIFTIFSGWLFLKEKASWVQITLTGVIIIALIMTITEGTFSLANVNIGALILFIVPGLWTIGHTVTKPLLQKCILLPSQVIFYRTMVSTLILSVLYFSTHPFSQFTLLLNPLNMINALLIAFAYLIGHFGWYGSIKNIDLSISSAVQAPQPILTSALATIILGEYFSNYQIIGLVLIVSSILVILYDKNKRQKLKQVKT